MRVLLILTVLMSLVLGAGLAFAEKPHPGSVLVPPVRMPCELGHITYNWNFDESDWGFTPTSCDDGGTPVWEYGQSFMFEGRSVWGTAISTPGEQYPSDSGEGLVSPSFVVDESSFLVEIFHSRCIEPWFDGANLSVNGEVVHPMEGYNWDVINEGINWYAWCVDGEPGWMACSYENFSCFDLSDFMGQEIQLSFDFGSDASVEMEGWYLVHVLVGSTAVPVEQTSWSHIKGLYR